MKKSKEERIHAFTKLTKCIFSCKTDEQLESCHKMIELYLRLFKDHNYDIKAEVDVLKEELIIQKSHIV